MRNLRKFSTTSDYNTWNTNDKPTPSVAFIEGTNTIAYHEYVQPHDYSLDYLTIVSTSDNNTIGWKTSDASLINTICVSTDNGQTWTDKTSTTSGVTLATLNTGDKMLIKKWQASYHTTYGSSSYYNYFTSTGTFDIQGNIMSMVYGDNFIGQTTLSESYVFKQLFRSTNVVNARNLVLPATILTDYCYANMFYGCTSLTAAPTLPATTLTRNCYYWMFAGCTSLTAAPTLPATTLAYYCYGNMFRECTSLTTAPTLPATTLIDWCYYLMFYGCIGLTASPVLPATTLAQLCYYQMFYGCTNLNQITCLATNMPANKCTSDWVQNVAGSGTFIKDPSMTSWTTGTSGIPSGWTVEDYQAAA